MAELNLGKGLTAGKVASNVQKKLTRAQEKVLQKLGKADETKDVAFEEGVINFNKQYTEGSKLQRDLRAYLEAVKAMHESSRNLQSCLADMYEPEWEGKNDVDSIVEDCDVLWTDYHQKLVDHALISMDTYLGQFPDIKARIAKRDRKLVDFDSARHNYSATHKNKKKDGGIKITKPSTLLERATPGWAQGILSAHNVAQSSLSRSQAEEELERAQKVFEEINIDLQEELPSLWNSRVGFYVSTFQSLAGFEEKFHKEIGRLDQDLNDTLVTLEGSDTTRKTGKRSAPSTSGPSRSSAPEPSNHTLRPAGPPPIPKSPSKLRPTVPPPPKVTPCKDMKTDNIINLFASAAAPDISITSPTQDANWDSWHEENSGSQEKEEPVHYDPVAAAQEGWGDEGSNHKGDVAVSPPGGEDEALASSPEAAHDLSPEPEKPTPEAPCGSEEGQSDSSAAQEPAAVAVEEPAAEEAPQTPVAALEPVEVPSESQDLPPGFLFKVQVMHDYAANDSDELEMKAGDVVLVINFTNPDEQDDGWLMGMKEGDWLQSRDNAAKGVFPENFTQRL